MEKLVYTNGIYQTGDQPISFFAKAFPSFTFYLKFLRLVFKASVRAKGFQYDGDEWSQSSFDVLRALENVGVCIEIRGIDHLRRLEEPCVFIANHMSMLETVVLPAIIQPVKDVTFVVKQSLLDYPIFKHIMRSRDPIAVSRKHPRDDFKAVLEGGVERLHAGRSIIIFPQTTRTPSFDPARFNTIGIKLARKARVPVVPIGLLSDAWGNGKYIKDFGKIDPSKNVFFAFGEPLRIQGHGNEEHAEILEFIRRSIYSARPPFSIDNT